MLIADLEKRDVAILGAGWEGRSVWRAIRRRFPDKPLAVYAESPPGEAFAGDFQSAHDRLVIGPLTAKVLACHEVLVRSPGISPYREEMQQAGRAGARFTTATGLWFAEHPRAHTICITGTKGKSTTAALTAHLLRAAGHGVRLAGNIGEPLLDCPDDGPDWWVIELSSYQLADLTARPRISAILNLSDAHLDWHGGRAAYRRDKLRLAALAAGNALIINHADGELRRRFAGRDGARWFNREDGIHVREQALYRARTEIARLPLPGLAGVHNLSNLAAALTILDVAGVDAGAFPGVLGGYAGLPHRLQHLGRRGGVAYVNDSLATTPVATVAALEALSGQAVTLLLGGQEGGVDWSGSIEKMRRCVPHAIIALPDSGPGLAKMIARDGLEPPAGIHEAQELAGAVQLARAITPAGGVVLLSPGAPSFPQFRNYAERGLQFAKLAGFGVAGETT